MSGDCSSQVLHGLALDLTDALAGESELFSDLSQGQGLSARETETACDDGALLVAEILEGD